MRYHLVVQRALITTFERIEELKYILWNQWLSTGTWMLKYAWCYMPRRLLESDLRDSSIFPLMTMISTYATYVRARYKYSRDVICSLTGNILDACNEEAVIRIDYLFIYCRESSLTSCDGVA